MTRNVGPFDLETVRLVMDPRGRATPKRVGPNFYSELDAEFGGFAGHLLISKHEFAEPWGVWEIHPKGDEIVYLLFGDVDFVLWSAGTERKVRLSEPGSYVIVPQGTWHTARPHERSAMLFVTAGEDTRHGKAPESVWGAFVATSPSFASRVRTKETGIIGAGQMESSIGRPAQLAGRVPIASRSPG